VVTVVEPVVELVVVVVATGTVVVDVVVLD